MLPKHKRRHAGSSHGARKPADVAVTLLSVEGLLCLYRENAIAIESEAGDWRAFARKERNFAL